jgi:hypothetical protein
MAKHEKERETPEWARTTEKLELPPEAIEKMQQIINSRPQPSDRLRAAAQRQWGK